MLSTVLVYLCTELECFIEGWNAFDSVGIPLYRVGMLSRGLECFRQCSYTFVQCGKAFYRVTIPLYRVGMPSIGLVYLCTGFECFLQGWNAL
jgi:hypothetical protein